MSLSDYCASGPGVRESERENRRGTERGNLRKSHLPIQSHAESATVAADIAGKRRRSTARTAVRGIRNEKAALDRFSRLVSMATDDDFERVQIRV